MLWDILTIQIDFSKFLQSLTTSLAVLVMLLSSDYNNFSAIFIIFLVFSVFYGRRAFLFKLRAQYKDFIKLRLTDLKPWEIIIRDH